MAIRSVSFDDEDESELCVFSGNDLLTSHYDFADLDWREVAERSLIDERRGLVIAQVAVLEDLIDEFILYLEDPADVETFRRALDEEMIGRRLTRFERGLERVGLLDGQASRLLDDLRAVVQRRNQLAHGTIHWQPTHMVPIRDIGKVDIELEWILIDRRSRGFERISMARLRRDVYDAIGAFEAALAYAEHFVEKAPRPTYFSGGAYLGPPTA